MTSEQEEFYKDRFFTLITEELKEIKNTHKMSMDKIMGKLVEQDKAISDIDSKVSNMKGFLSGVSVVISLIVTVLSNLTWRNFFGKS